ncbi:MAG: biotin--[acetyl-CoA-carboxylase] ligase [Longimicrobiales bacterium]
MRLAHELAAWEGKTVEEWQGRWRTPQLHILSSTGSTNDDARALGNAGAPTGTLVIAEEQTAGRGRRGRTWIDAPGRSLQLSMLLRAPPAGFICLTAAPVRVGLLLVHALREQVGLHTQLKWPNDLQVHERKLGGILCESVLDQRPFLVLGIGINVGQQEDDFPPDLRAHATSITLATGTDCQRTDIAGAFAFQLLARADRIADRLTQSELDTFSACDVLRGREIEIDGRPAGTAIGIDPEGALLVRSARGVTPIHTGTVRTDNAIS